MPRNGSPQRVALVYRDSLLTQGVQALLEASAEFVVDAVDLDEADAGQRLRAMDASLVVVDTADLTLEPGVLASLLDARPDMRIVCLHSDGDYLDIYEKRRVPISKACDLHGAIAAA